MSWINPQIQEILHQQPPWRNFAFKVIDADDGIFLLVSVEELAKFSQAQQDDIIAWLLGILNSIRRLQVPCYIHEWKNNT